jgi:hypothetical protein
VRDLAATADTERLYVVSLSWRRVVEPTLANAAALHAVPPIARLLFEIPRARSAALAPFAWRIAACLPFLPRIRYGRSVLIPARWRILSRQLPGADAPWPVWHSAMTALRERLRLPASVQVGTADRRLRLNLDEAMDLDLLRAHVDGAGEATLVWEAPTASDHGWFAGRAHEIVIPLASTTPAVPAPAIVTSMGPRSPMGRSRPLRQRNPRLPRSTPTAQRHNRAGRDRSRPQQHNARYPGRGPAPPLDPDTTSTDQTPASPSCGNPGGLSVHAPQR